MFELCKYVFHIVLFTVKYVWNRVDVLVDSFALRKLELCQCKTLIVTHNLKGGTDVYLKSLNENNTIVLRNLEYVWHLCYKITVGDNSFYISDHRLNKIFSQKYEKVIVNSLVKMQQVDKLIMLLKKNKKDYPNAQLVYLVHDYHSICPNFNLIYNQEFCQFKCDRCNYRKPIVYGCRKYVDVREWRKSWIELFDLCNEIRCFSNSSKNILNAIYPSVASKITIVPHNVPKNVGEYKIHGNDELVVCFCGVINNDAKGLSQARILTEMLMDFCKIVFIGSVEKEIGIQNENVTYVGRYKHDELVTIMNDCRANLAIFPSVCPETFSFMMSELIQTGIKVLAFDVGAQGEKAKSYYNGMVFQTCEDMVAYVKSTYKGCDGRK